MAGERAAGAGAGNDDNLPPAPTSVQPSAASVPLVPPPSKKKVDARALVGAGNGGNQQVKHSRAGRLLQMSKSSQPAVHTRITLTRRMNE